MAFIPSSGSVVAFQSDPSKLQASITGTVVISGSIFSTSSVSGTVGASIIGLPPVNITNTNLNVSGSVIAFPTGNQSVSGTITVASLIAMPGIVSTANSTTTPVTSTLSFTGTGEEWKDFGSIVINVFTDATSGTDGLSIQQSSDNSNWDIRDVYTVPSMIAGQGKSFQVQPAARFGRIVYTQGPTNSGAFRLQTIYHPQLVKPTSQRPQDAYTNETDTEQQQGFNMVYNGTTWDRQRGNTTGTFITGSVQAAVSGSVIAFQGTTPWIIGSVYGNIAGSVVAFQGTVPWTVSSVYGNISGSVVAFQGGTQITSVAGTVIIGSIVGTYGEDVPSTAADKGIFTLGIRNDTVASLVGTDLDYTGWSTDSAGRHLVKPFAAEEAVLRGHGSVNGAASIQLLAAGAAGLKTYLTDFTVANTGTTATLVTFTDGDASVIGRTIAPAGGGSNVPGLNVPFVTGRTASPINMVAATATSVLYGWAGGYKAP